MGERLGSQGGNRTELWGSMTRRSRLCRALVVWAVHLLRVGCDGSGMEVSGLTLGGGGLMPIQSRSGAWGLCSDLFAFCPCLQNAQAA